MYALDPRSTVIMHERHRKIQRNAQISVHGPTVGKRVNRLSLAASAGDWRKVRRLTLRCCTVYPAELPLDLTQFSNVKEILINFGRKPWIDYASSFLQRMKVPIQVGVVAVSYAGRFNADIDEFSQHVFHSALVLPRRGDATKGKYKGTAEKLCTIVNEGPGEEVFWEKVTALVQRRQADPNVFKEGLCTVLQKRQ
ncbi:hypothetical protein VNI00_016671 [Paramarasmius palmivorus]|uniref:Uncharacterized protein n=1 Tax=Paramarasmius palmivorus TaxID=297713 RepID=A0AAW0BE06_9AGAR